MEIALGVVLVFLAGFGAFRLHGRLWPQPMSMALEQFFLDNPLRRRFFGPRQALGLLGPVSGARVAEIGVGVGVMLAELARRVGEDGRVWGIDIQHEAVRRTKARLAREGWGPNRVQVTWGRAEELPWPDHSLDRVVMVAVLGEIPPAHRLLALAEIVRVLKPEGAFILTEFWPDPHYVKLPDAIRQLSRAGLEVTAEKKMPLIYTVSARPGPGSGYHP